MAESARSRVGGQVSVLEGQRTVRVERRPLPEPGPGEVRVRITAFGICGTDVHAWRGRGGRYGVTLGHDAVGMVESWGPDVVPPVPRGTRVLIDPTLACGTCGFCVAGRGNVCPHGAYLGMGAPGTMAEFIVVPAVNLVPVPEALSDELATMVEPATVALQLLQRTSSLSVGERAHVIGAGPLGVVAAMLLRSQGMSVLLHEPLGWRRQLAADLGLDVTDTAVEPVPDAEPVLVVETSATASGAERAWRLATPGSTVAVVGRAVWEAPLADILLRELSVLGIRSGMGHYPQAMELLTGELSGAAALLTHRFPFTSLGEAFAAVADPEARVMRSVIAYPADSPTQVGNR